MRHPKRHSVRTAAALAASAVLTTTFVGPASAGPADPGGQWLQGELSGDGLVHDSYEDSEGVHQYVDHGLTADFGFAFAELGQDDAATTVRDALEDLAKRYTAPGRKVYAGSTAKLATLVQVTGGDPRSYGGLDLIQQLSGDLRTGARNRGRIADSFGNTVGQAFAVRALATAGSGKATDARRFLLEQQCSPGYFRLDFSPKADHDQTCDGARRADAAPDTDATALSVLALKGLPRAQKTRRTRAAVDNATDWLVKRQKANGSFGGGVATEASNTNSTGLAAWALGEVGACRPAADAAAWVSGLQVPADATGPLAGEDGAIAYDRAAYDAAENDGITDAVDDQWRRATSQAAPGLAVAAGC